MRKRPRYLRGFNLIEVSIVIAVAGIILGAIWEAGGAAYENARRGQLAEELTAVVNNVRVAYNGQASIAGAIGGVGSCPGGAACFYPDAQGNANSATLTGHLAILGTIPGDMVRNRNAFQAGGDMYVDGPWGVQGGTNGANLPVGSFFVCAANTGVSPVTCTNNTSQSFVVELQGLRADSCIAITTANSSSNGPPGLQDVTINNVSMVGLGDGLPVLVADANTECALAGANGSTVDFVYLLRAPAP